MSEEFDNGLEQKSLTKSCENCGSKDGVKSIKIQRRYKKKTKVLQRSLCVRCRKSYRGK